MGSLRSIGLIFIAIWTLPRGESVFQQIKSKFGDSVTNEAGPPPNKGGPADLHDCSGSDEKLWELGTDGTIKSKLDGNCLDWLQTDAEHQPNPNVMPCNGQDKQRWSITSDEQLKNQANGLCLGVSHTELATCDANTKGQKWEFVDAGAVATSNEGEGSPNAKGYYRLRNVGQLKCLTASDSTAYLDDCKMDENQKWRRTKNGHLKNKGSDHCLCQGETNSDSNISLEKCKAKARSQLWTLKGNVYKNKASGGYLTSKEVPNTEGNIPVYAAKLKVPGAYSQFEKI